MVSLLFHFGVFFTVCSDECFQCCGHSEGPSLKKSLYSCSCFHNRVCDYIHKHCTCRVQVPCPPETNRTFSAVIGQRYWHFFLQLISINVGRMLQKACVKNSSKLFVSSSNHHFRAKSLPWPLITHLLNVKKWQYILGLHLCNFSCVFFPKFWNGKCCILLEVQMDN